MTLVYKGGVCTWLGCKQTVCYLMRSAEFDVHGDPGTNPPADPKGPLQEDPVAWQVRNQSNYFWIGSYIHLLLPL